MLNRVTYTEAEIEAQHCTLLNTWVDNSSKILNQLFFQKPLWMFTFSERVILTSATSWLKNQEGKPGVGGPGCFVL